MPEKNERLSLPELLRFLLVLAVFGGALATITTTRPDLTVLQREVGRHTVFMLGLMGASAELEEVYVRIPEGSPEVIEKLRVLGLTEKNTSQGVVMYAPRLNPELERIVLKYVDHLQSLGEPVFLSRAVVSLKDGPLDVEIIPECTGLFGFMAVSALIIGYPRAGWRKKILGVAVALPLVHLVNVLRLSTSILSAHLAGVSAFHFTHDLLWKTVLLAFSFLFWLGWIKFFPEGKL